MELDLSIPGAREQRAKLQVFHTWLNHERIVPEQAYRMSMTIYWLTSFANNIIALHCSKNYEVIPVFIGRAHRHMMEHPPTPAAAAYYELLARYLRQMAFVLKEYTSVSRESLQTFVPAEILEAGPQEAPSGEVGA
jgi:hypothetical protein